MKITAYIPCYNVAAYIEPTIQALLNQTRPPDELLIIDDGSKDRTVEVASRYPVRVIRHQGNQGLAAARNTAFTNAQHELVASVDADVIVEPRWLESLAEAFVDDNVAGSGGRLLEAFRDTPADAWRAKHMAQDLGEDRIEMAYPTVKRLGGFGTIFRKDAVERVGGYDPQFRTNWEDVDLCTRLLRAGCKLVFEPRAIGHHQRRDTISSVVRTAWRWDFYYHYSSGGYNNIALKVLLNFRYARILMWNHLKEGMPSLLWVDAELPWLQSYMDLRYRFSPGRLPPPEGVEREANEKYFPRPLRTLRRLFHPKKRSEVA
jgi:GT2 family glycosyltransferase